MKNYLSLFLSVLPVVFVICIIFSPDAALAGGDHGDTGELEHVVPIEGKSGLSLTLAVLYNDYRLVFALVVTFTMAILGIVIGRLTEFVLKLAGLK